MKLGAGHCFVAHICLGSVLPLEMFVFKLEVGLVGVRLVWRIVTVWGELRAFNVNIVNKYISIQYNPMCTHFSGCKPIKEEVLRILIL